MDKIELCLAICLEKPPEKRRECLETCDKMHLPLDYWLARKTLEEKEK